jgi:putative flavoprotein involved in K+ transport
MSADPAMRGDAAVAARVGLWLAAFERALVSRDIAETLSLFGGECFWRDLVAFTWNIRTFEGRDDIHAMLAANLARVRPSGFRVDGWSNAVDGVDEARFVFETALARGQGYVRLRDGKAWTLLTAISELKGYEEKRGARRDNGVELGAQRGRRTWLERRTEELEGLGVARQPYCVIVGASQGGLALGARLRQLDVPTITLDRLPRVGDAWRRRYKSLCLHDPVWYDHMPYLPFPDHWPVFTPKDKLGDWLESYATLMELDCWTSSPCIAARWDDATQEWRVEVDREGTRVTLRPKHLVLATGMSGVPEIPRFPGAELFRGEQHHSSRHVSGEAYAGKQCVVVGSNNSAHDIAADLWEHGADVTMIQRSPTIVARSESLTRFASSLLYSEAALARGITTELADLMNAAVPFRLQPQRARLIYDQIRAHDREFYAALERSGFQLHFGDGDGGIPVAYARRGSGYYIDVGASQLIIDGEIKLRSRVEIERLTERSVVLSDGSELPADLVVYATGFGSMNGWAAELIGRDVADKVGKCWGLGSGTDKDPGPWEGELRNMWRPTRQDGLWFHGGNLAQARFYSLILALQIKARQVGIDTPAYAPQAVHHLS